MRLFLVSSSMSPTHSLLTHGYQRGSAQKFWKFARLLSLIWAFRKSTSEVVMKMSIFSYRRFSQTIALKNTKDEKVGLFLKFFYFFFNFCYLIRVMCVWWNALKCVFGSLDLVKIWENGTSFSEKCQYLKKPLKKRPIHSLLTTVFLNWS